MCIIILYMDGVIGIIIIIDNVINNVSILIIEFIPIVEFSLIPVYKLHFMQNVTSF